MSDAFVTGGAPETTAIPQEGPLSIREAAESVAKRREESETETKEAKPERDRDTSGRFAPKESAPQEHDAGPETVPSEEAETADPVEPSIKPPRSWSKEDKELFATLPPETQERIVEREKSRESDFLKRQNELSTHQKAIQAQWQAAQQARSQYEQAALRSLQELQGQFMAEFQDIRSEADMKRLAEEDPFRFARFQAHREGMQIRAQQVAAVQAQRAGEQQRQQVENIRRFEAWASEQDKAFEKHAKNYGEKERSEVMTFLTEDVGVPKEALPQLWNNPLFRDHRMQRIVFQASRFAAAQKAAKEVATKPVPPVQRPGTAPSKGSGGQGQIAAAEERLAKATTTREQLSAAADLRAARRAAERK